MPAAAARRPRLSDAHPVVAVARLTAGLTGGTERRRRRGSPGYGQAAATNPPPAARSPCRGHPGRDQPGDDGVENDVPLHWAIPSNCSASRSGAPWSRRSPLGRRDEVFTRREHVDPATEVAEPRPVPPARGQGTDGDHVVLGAREHLTSRPVVAGGCQHDEALHVTDAPLVDLVEGGEGEDPGWSTRRR